jgi:hypothetical protein
MGETLTRKPTTTSASGKACFGNQFINARRVISTVVVIEPKPFLRAFKYIILKHRFKIIFLQRNKICVVYSLSINSLLAIESL